VSTPSRGLRQNGYRENPPKKDLVAFGADESSFSEPTKGLKEGVLHTLSEECVGREEKKWGW